MGSTSSYSYGKSREMLSAMPEQHQEAFVVYCSARMLPFYDAFARRMKLKNAGSLRHIVDRLWSLVSDGEITEEETEELGATLAKLPLGEDGCCDERWEAIAAADAVQGAFEWCCFTSSHHPVYAIEGISGVIYQRLTEELSRSKDPPENPDEDQVFTHPLMKSAMQEVMEVLEFLKDREELVEGDVKYLRMLAEKRLLPDR